MDRFYALVGLIAIVVLPIQFVCVLSDDLSHPERWDTDRLHDPRGYVLIGGVGGLVLLVLLARELIRPPLSVRLNQMLERARALRAAGRHAEADRVLDAFERLWKWHGLHKQYPLCGKEKTDGC